MKRILFFAMALAAMVACKNSEPGPDQGGEYTLTMNFKVYQENGIEIDSVFVKDGKGQLLHSQALNDSIFQVSGTIDTACIATLDFVFRRGEAEPSAQSLSLILEPGNISYDIEKGVFCGSALNDSVSAFYYEKLMPMLMGEEEANTDSLVCDYVARHCNDLSAPFIIIEAGSSLVSDGNKLSELIDRFPERYQQLPRIQEIKEKMEKIKKSAEGQMFIDFEAEYDGKVQRLSDYVGKGKYVLVDFWASWCGPCRAEIPNLKAVHEKYAGEKFEVLGVATWDEPENTLQAIEEEGVTYPQIINAQQAGSNAYSIDGIPQIILFGPDGTILKRNLRGAGIEQAVAEALGETL